MNGGYREEPDLNAEYPSGMCMEPTVCNHCPSNFLCTIKARAELDAIRARSDQKSEGFA